MSSASDEASRLEIEVNAEVRLLTTRAQSNARRAVNIMRNNALEVLGHDGHGRKYGRHTASAPGQPPAPDKGNLRRNWRQYVLARGAVSGMTITCRLKSDTKYAEYLEHGTSRMAARPFKDKIVEASMPEIDRIFDDLG